MSDNLPPIHWETDPNSNLLKVIEWRNVECFIVIWNYEQVLNLYFNDEVTHNLVINNVISNRKFQSDFHNSKELSPER